MTLELGNERVGIAGFPEVERRVLELGADDYIVKPFDPTELLSSVNGVFRRLKVTAA